MARTASCSKCNTNLALVVPQIAENGDLRFHLVAQPLHFEPSVLLQCVCCKAVCCGERQHSTAQGTPIALFNAQINSALRQSK